jgi:FtsH-binding integral membrane protein
MRWFLEQFAQPASREGRNEQRKLRAAVLNTMSITLLVAGLFGPYINQASMSEATWLLRGFMIFGALVAHYLAQWVVRGTEDK